MRIHLLALLLFCQPVLAAEEGFSALSPEAIDQQIEQCRQKVHKNMKDVDSLNALGKLFKAKREYDYAESAFKQALDADPKNETALLNLGRINEKQGDVQKAQSFYEKALNANPTNPVTLATLGCLLKDQGKISAAEKLLERAKARSTKPDLKTLNGNIDRLLQSCHAEAHQ